MLPTMDNEDVRVISITGEMIRLGQFLKFANFAESGAVARELIVGGDVTVDGQLETRRGRQLGKGALVKVAMPGQTLSARVG